MAYKRNYKTKSFEEKQKEIEELTSSMDTQMESYFESEDKIQEHLKFMSNFHKYSARNMALIDKQFMGAKAVGSYNYWQSREVQIKKGEKGIKILVPTPIEYFKRGIDTNGKDNWVKVTSANAQEKKLLEKGALKTKKVMFFKVGHVFEYTQTNAREKGIEVSEIFGRYHREGSIENDQEFMKAFGKIAQEINVNITDTPPTELGTAKGGFYPDLNVIAMNQRNTTADNIPVMLHELAHAELHNREREKKREHQLTTNEKEFQAEMTAYVVASHYGIEMENFSLPYLANWTKNANLQDKEQLLNEIRKTAGKFIDVIDQHFVEVKLLEKEQVLSDSLTISEKQPEISETTMLLNEMALSTHKEKHGVVKINEPSMMIHGYMKDFQPFGKVNNADYDQIKVNEIKYTVAIPNDEKGLHVFSGEYEKSNYVFPLHHMEKNGTDKEIYTTLENHWHGELQREEDKYLQKIAPRIVAEVHKGERVSESKLSIRGHELER